jgi:hypothetical protein
VLWTARRPPAAQQPAAAPRPAAARFERVLQG